ncbi:MAG: hypothetical protein K2O17_04105 [Bacteroidaceae bacterium]|nr:hypothetical protein [Bacteroidaceae bacterium]
MSKKLTSLLVLVLALFMSIGASAQDASLKGKQITMGGALGTLEPNTWYFVYNGSRSAEMERFLNIGDIPDKGGVMTDVSTDEEPNAKSKKMSVTGVPEGSIATAKAGYLVRFIEAGEDGESEVYNIQFGTGKWLTDDLTVSDNIYDAGTFNFYNIDPENDPGKFGFNKYNMEGLVNNQGTNGNLTYWLSGQIETTDYDALDYWKGGNDTSNSVWNILEVVFEELDERNAAIMEFWNTLQDYFDLFTNATFDIGTDPGQYTQESYDEMNNYFEELYNVDDSDESIPTEWFVEKTQEIKDKYNAFLKSVIPYTLADGYYRIKGGKLFTNALPTGETDEEGNAITEEVQLYKYMYSTQSGDDIIARWNTPDQLDIFAPALWKVTNKDGYFDIVNVDTEARFNNVATSATATMSPDSENLMALIPAATEDGVTYVNIRVSTQTTGAFYLHMGGHGGGVNKAGNIVGWNPTYGSEGPGCSEWVFEPVSEEEVQAAIEGYEPVKNRDKMLAMYDSILTAAKANLAIAEAIETVFDMDKPLVTSSEQFSSPYSQNDLGSADGGNLADDVLIDGDVATFWHSFWGGGNVTKDTHYLQVAINDADVSIEELAIIISRRSAAANDHITKFNVRGTNNADAEKEDCELLGTLVTPFESRNDVNVKSNTFKNKGYKYLRFYEELTTNDRGYFHLAEFQLYPATTGQASNAQAPHMGDLYTNLENIVTAQAELTRDEITIEVYNALKEAYDAFMTKFVDPTEMKNLLASLEGTGDDVIIGTDPGFWSADSDAGAFKLLYEAAKAYHESGDFTPEQSKAYIEQLQKGASDLYASANKIQEGKWYRITFPSIDDFDQYGWDTVAGDAPHNDNINEDTSEELFGKSVVAATLETTERTYTNDNGAEVKVSVYRVQEAEAEELGVGSGVYVLNHEDLQNPDMALFRFVAVGDSAYILQNKATNLFICAQGTSGAVSLSAHPSLFEVSAIGYGLNGIHAKSITGVDQKYLHVQVAANTLVTWGPNFVAEPNTRSALYIEEVEDVAGDYAGATFNYEVIPGELNILCYPVSISCNDDEAQMWGVNSVEGTTITLAKIEEAIPGRPFILVKGTYDESASDEEREESAVMAVLNHGYSIVQEAQTGRILNGTFAREVVGAGVVVPEKDKLVITKKSNTAVAANTGYIAPAAGEKYTQDDFESTIEIVWDENAADGIQTALANVSKSGAVYTIDGRLVSRKANLNDLSRFGKGIYILNGTKVVVK